MVSQLTEKTLTCAAECGFKSTGKGDKEATANSPWFDKECVKLKKEIQHLAISLKHSPNNITIREKGFF